MAAPKGPRPITRALDILAGAVWLEYSQTYQLLAADYRELRRILKSRDASSDTPDSKRKRPAKKARR